ncbi:putative ribosome biogenesis GTPase RsgA [Catenulispora sp. EB89]|uniref:AAA family ATPase n=1 Tax=Catenulispora sp. EB89 TaxID=3156257 RepID=UPI003512ED9A
MDSIGMAMVGRQAEQAELAAFVKAAAGQALVLRGETGVGKSALLGLAADLAEQEGHLVVRAAGLDAPQEAPTAFAQAVVDADHL